MQSPGPAAYQGIGSTSGPSVATDHYTERAYDNHLNSHHNSYIAYHPQFSSPSSSSSSSSSPSSSSYPHSNQYNNILSSGSPYSSSSHLFNSTSSHYSSNCNDIYNSRGGSRADYGSLRPLNKLYWSDHPMSIQSAHVYSQGGHSSTRNPVMNSPPASMEPPSLRSSPLVCQTNYNPNDRHASSPLNWQNSPRATPPSPMSHNSTNCRSPAHNGPQFSPTTPTMSSHSSSAKGIPATIGSQVVGQAASQSTPLQSLQKMVMLDSDSADSGGSHNSYDSMHVVSPPTQKPYFSTVEHTDGPGSPYPTYYNLDQNRLCTPPRLSPTQNSSIYPSKLTSTTPTSSCSSSSDSKEKDSKPGDAMNDQPREKVELSLNSNAKAKKGSEKELRNCSRASPDLKPNTVTPVKMCPPLSSEAIVKTRANSVDSHNSSDSDGFYPNSEFKSNQYENELAKSSWSCDDNKYSDNKNIKWNSAEDQAKRYHPIHNSSAKPHVFSGIPYSDSNLMPPPATPNAFHSAVGSHEAMNWQNSAVQAPHLNGQTVNREQAPKKKRGRPYGSKNKPKAVNTLPDAESKKHVKKHEESSNALVGIISSTKSSPSASQKTVNRASSTKKRKPETEEMGVNTTVTVDAHSDEQLGILPQSHKNSKAPSTSNKTNKTTGPYIHVERSKDKRTVNYVIVNVTKRLDNEKDSKLPHIPSNKIFGSNLRRPSIGAAKKKVKLHQHELTRDASWICTLCKQGNHYKNLGDLFGPYYINMESRNPNFLENGEEASISDEHDSSTSSNKKVKRQYKRKSDATDETSRQSKSPGKIQVEQGNESTEVHGNGAPNSIQQQEVWFHEDCIIWSSGVHLIGHRIRNLEEIIRDSNDTMCSSCKLVGATLGCFHKSCANRFHFTCAKEKGCDVDEENFSIYCPKHRKKSSAAGQTDPRNRLNL